jgi:two-component system sensor histidine kinase/response regulator
MTTLPVPRILIVDDQPANLQVLGTTLGKLGYEVIPASDGSTALKRVALRPPDLVLLDVLMPAIDGFEVCRRIREQPAFAETPVIFLSAADDKDLIVRALECGGVDYITKPFNQAELVLRVQTHLSLKAARDRLARLAQDKEELLGILAHDLKNHVGGLHMTAELLRDRIPPEDTRLREIAQNLASASGRTLTFLREFLANAASDHGFKITPSPLELNEVVRQAVQSYEAPAQQKQQRIETSLYSKPIQAKADAAALRQIVDNLLSNAVKFSPYGKTIRVATRVCGQGAEISVQDEGPGILPADRERLFRRYTRLSARPTGGEPSTGLGLSIVRSLAHAMGGEVTFNPAPESGSCFVVKLPLAEPSC